jgi:hypothetical protein
VLGLAAPDVDAQERGVALLELPRGACAVRRACCASWTRSPASRARAGAAGMAELLCDAKLACDRARQAGSGQVEEAARARLVARYQRLLADGQAANPPPRPQRAGRGHRRQPRSPATRLLARLDSHRDEVLRFLDDLRVPLTTTRPNATCAW